MLSRLLFLILFAATSSAVWGEDLFIRRSGNQFVRGSESTPYIYKGVTYRFAPLRSGLAHKADRRQLCAQLDSLQKVGITNLRVMLSADGSIPRAAQGDSLLRGLDYLLQEMQRRGQFAVLCFPEPADSLGGFPVGPSADSLRADYGAWLTRVVTHVNSHSRQSYRDDPTIMAWQLGERHRLTRAADGEALYAWVRETAVRLDSLDSRHLITLGTEGIRGFGDDAQLYRRLHSIRHIDYLTLQLRPLEWHWTSKSAVFTALSRVYNLSTDYLAQHDRIAFFLRKPLVIESVSYPDDIGLAQSGSGTQARDAYFDFVLSWLTHNRPADTSLCGVRLGE